MFPSTLTIFFNLLEPDRHRQRQGTIRHDQQHCSSSSSPERRRRRQRQQQQQQQRCRPHHHGPGLFSTTTRTPMQQRMRRARYRRQVTSMKFWLMFLSSCSFLVMIVYFLQAYRDVVPRGMMHHQQQQQQQQQLQYQHQHQHHAQVSSTVWNTTPSNNTYKNHDDWENNENSQKQQKQQQHLSTASTRVKRVFPVPFLWQNGSTEQLEEQGDVDNKENNDDDDNDNSPPSFHFFRGGVTTPEEQRDSEKQHQQQQQTSNNNSPNDSDNPNDNNNNGSPYKNPALYGWTPDIYPNPVVNPTRCAIAYIHPPAGWNIDNETMGNNNNNKTSASTGLRLCDPDWVLGGVYLEDIAAAMYNFSMVFGQERHLDENDDHWDVAVGPSGGRRRLLRSLQQRQVQWQFQQERQQQQQQHRKLQHQQQQESRPQQQQQKDDPISYSTMHPHAGLTWRRERLLESDGEDSLVLPRVELAVATVRKMNLPSVLRQGSYYAYEDEDDMVNDAAQVFARALHDSWWRSHTCTPRAPYPDDSTTDTTDIDPSLAPTEQNEDPSCTDTEGAAHGILIFLSIQDHVCFISTGSAISSILPWWRLDNIVASMKPDLRRRDYGNALLNAIRDLSDMLEAGPPTLSDRLHDFIARFGVVIAFAAFTFFFGAWGEYRDRRKRWQYAEQRSKLSSVEREKARQLQKEYKNRSCPICLEVFPCDNEDDLLWNSPVPEGKTDHTAGDKSCDATENIRSNDSPDSDLGKPTEGTSLLKRVDTYGIPLHGADGKKIKMLRCGHIFCETCWESWVHSGCGNPCNCPMCRQDVGKNPRKRGHRAAATTAATREASLDGNAGSEASESNEDLQSRSEASGNSSDRPTMLLGYDALTVLQQPALFRGTALIVSNRVPRSGRSSSSSRSTESTPLLAGGIASQEQQDSNNSSRSELEPGASINDLLL